MRAELDVVAPAAEIAEKGGADGGPIAVIAISHVEIEWLLEKSLAFVIFRTKPYRSPKAGPLDRIETREPKDFIREGERGRLQRSHPAFRIHDHKNSERGLCELPFEPAGDRVLEIALDLPPPHRKTFVS